MFSSVILGILVFCILVVAGVYFIGLRPARIMEKWAAGLSNGGHFPKKAVVNGLYWLLPVHREMQAVADKIEDLKRQLEAAKSGNSEDEFLNHCVLASLLEGVLVVDAQGVVTLANAEFIHMFQLNQSPLRRNMSEIIRDRKMQTMIVEAMTVARVQSGRFTRPATTGEVGRPQTIEVSAVPLRFQKDKTGGAIVLFLPPPDRLRIVQDMKRHSQRLNNLVSEVALTRFGKFGAHQLNKEPVDLPQLLKAALSDFASRAGDSAIKTNCHIDENLPPLSADEGLLQVAMAHLLDNLAFDLEAVSDVVVVVRSEDGGVVIQTTFDGGSMSDAQLQRTLALPIDLRSPTLPMIGGSSLGLVRGVMELHGGSVEALLADGKKPSVRLCFPAPAKTDLTLLDAQTHSL